MKHYHITYVTEINKVLSFSVEAENWQELKKEIDKKLPVEATYILGISFLSV